MMPMMASNILQSIRLLSNVSRALADRCIDGIEADVEHCRELAESSPSIVTPLNRFIGYENAAAVAKKCAQGASDHPRGRRSPRGTSSPARSPRSSWTPPSTYSR